MESDSSSRIDLKSQILSKIEKEAVVPRSRLFYRSYHMGLWFVWLITAVVGSVAVAVTLSIVSYKQFALYEVTHPNFIDFAMDYLPLLWIVVFISMLILAAYNLRHTKTGYRYPLWQILSSSLVISILGGFSLHILGMGFAVDKQFGVLTDYYQSQERLEQRMWQQPEQGRLLGVMLEEEIIQPMPFVNFIDSRSGNWQLDITELDEEDIINLNSRKLVRVLGVLQTNTEYKSFHACAVFPWVYDYEHTIKELSEMRNKMKNQLLRRKLNKTNNERKFEEGEKNCLLQQL